MPNLSLSLLKRSIFSFFNLCCVAFSSFFPPSFFPLFYLESSLFSVHVLLHLIKRRCFLLSEAEKYSRHRIEKDLSERRRGFFRFSVLSLLQKKGRRKVTKVSSASKTNKKLLFSTLLFLLLFCPCD